MWDVGRQIAAILRDSLCRKSNNSSIANNNNHGGHTKRHLWISVSRELIQDARRDLKAVRVHCDVHDGTMLLGNDFSKDKGIMFLTYPLLVSGQRLEQIITWCAGTHLLRASTTTAKKREMERAFSGCIIFDEAHKAKNIANDTKTAQLVLELQRRLPKARVVYCSATGVSDVAHLAYAERLGLWDTASPSSPATSTHNFHNFEAFRNSLTSRGLGSLEMLALELKQQGSFLARTLSWDGAEFENCQVELTNSQRRVYDASVRWWNRCRVCFEVALKMTNQKSGLAWRIFWSTHQRFFKELAICAKVDYIANDALRKVNEGCCVVVGLQSTGESGMQSLIENGNMAMFQEKQFATLLSTCQATLSNFLKNNFPLTPVPPEAPKLPEKAPPPEAGSVQRQQYAWIKAEIARITALPPPDPLPPLVEMRQTLLDENQSLNLPPNPLDDLLDRFGVDNVAEMTGRTVRMVRKEGSFVLMRRVTVTNNGPASQDDSDRLNLVERRSFQEGEKAFAIISDAASTGISLHAARGSKGSHRRRVHYTIELPWSADKAVQQLGRSHRSGQETAPIYKMVVTSLGGERRFAASVARRISSLGALCQGDRRAATGGEMFADFDLDSKYGKRALRQLYSALEKNLYFQSEANAGIASSPSMPSRNSKEIIAEFLRQLTRDRDPFLNELPSNEDLRDSQLLSLAISEMELVGIDAEARKKSDVRVFLNRLAGLAVTRQAFVFSLFMSTMEDVVKSAKITGEYVGSAEDITATTMEVAKEIDLATDPVSGAKTRLTILNLDRGVSFEAVCIAALEDGRKFKSSYKDLSPVIDGEIADTTADVVKLSDQTEDQRPPRKGEGKHGIALPGFYVSRNKIAGRQFILYAKQLVDRSSSDATHEANDLGWMVVTRPNTGLGNEMTSSELKRKYKLLLGCDALVQQMNDTKDADAEIVRQTNPEVAERWRAAYDESDHLTHNKGLAPRRAEVGLITGPCLHIFASLENAVLHRSEKERALKIMRAQVQGRRIVGVRFPADDDALQKLRAELAKNSRNNTNEWFVNEDLSPVCEKSTRWATEERKTIKSFFAVKSTTTTCTTTPRTEGCPTTSQGKRKSGSSESKAKVPSSNKKLKSIVGFFAPAAKN